MEAGPSTEGEAIVTEQLVAGLNDGSVRIQPRLRGLRESNSAY